MSPEEWAKRDRAYVESQAGVIAPGVATNPELIGEAKAELVRRDHAYAVEQEQDRRHYEDDRAAKRREHEEQLMRRQMEHASKLSQEQLATARSARNAARWAAGAAALAAFGALIQAVIAALQRWLPLPPHG